jgi:hypothetical protein
VPRFPFVPPDGLDAAPLRAVGVRFDGCFPGKAGCEPQIRVVMQPVKNDGTALDSALHLFFRLTEDELALVTTELRRLRTLAPEVADDGKFGVSGSGDVLIAAVADRLRTLIAATPGARFRITVQLEVEEP